MEKIIDIEERIPTLKKRREKRTNRKFILLIVVFIIVLAVLLYFQSPYSDIKSIQVKGAHLVNEDYYIEASTLTNGQSMWGFKVDDVEKALKKDKWVRKVEVERKWLRTVNIEVKEWRKVAYIESDGSYYPLLENGERFEQLNETYPIDAPIFIGIADEKIIKKLVKQMVNLDSEVFTLISQVTVNPTSIDPNAVKLYMNDGYEVRAVISTMAEKLNYYPSMVAQITDLEKGIIDLEVGSSFRPYNKEYNTLNLQLTNEDGSQSSSSKSEDGQANLAEETEEIIGQEVTEDDETE